MNFPKTLKMPYGFGKRQQGIFRKLKKNCDFFQNDVFKLQEVFSELGIRVFSEKVLGSFQAFSILQI
jgi:hypothetical protein